MNEYEDMLVTGNTPVANEYDSMLQDQKLQDKQTIQNNVFATKDVTPERQMQVTELAKKLNLPEPFVQNNFDDLNKKTQGRSFDYDKIIEETPSLAKWLQKPGNVALGKDDIEGLGKVSGHVQRFTPQKDDPITIHKEMGQALGGGWLQMKKATYFTAAVKGWMKPDDAINEILKLNEQQAAYQNSAPDYVKEADPIYDKEAKEFGQAFAGTITDTKEAYKKGRYVDAVRYAAQNGISTVGEFLDLVYEAAKHPRATAYKITENLPFAVPAIGLSAGGGYVGGGEGSIAGMFLGSAGVTYMTELEQVMQDNGVDINDADSLRAAFQNQKLMSEVKRRAANKAMVLGAVESIFSAIGGRAAGKAAGEAIERSLMQSARHKAGEVGLEMAGEGMGEFGGELAKHDLDVSKVDAGQAALESIFSLGQSVGTVAIKTPVKGVSELRGKFSTSTDKAIKETAQKTAGAVKLIKDIESIEKTIDEIGKLKNVNKSPEKVKELIDHATGGDDGAQVYFQKDDFDNYWNKKGKSPADEAAKLLGDEGKSYREADATGNDISVPVGKLISEIAAQPDNKDILNITRTEVDGQSMADAKEHMKRLPELMQSLVGESMQPDDSVSPEAQKEVQGIEKDVYEQLKAAGVKSDDARKQAQLNASVFNSLAQRSGISPFELYNKYGLRIRGPEQMTEIQAGESVLNQSGESPKISDLGFYSKLEKTVLDKIQGKSAEVGQIEALLRDVKPDERKWSGIDEFLKGKTKIDKQELIDFLRLNQLEIKEVTLGGHGMKASDGSDLTGDNLGRVHVLFASDGDEIGVYNSAQEADSARERYQNETGDENWAVTEYDLDTYLGDLSESGESSQTKFSQYTLPGGENYREVLLTMPAKPLTEIPEGFYETKSNDGKTIQIRDKSGRIAGFGPTLDAALKDLAHLNTDVQNQFTSSHFDEKNILAHVRLNDRVDADGKRVLFVEEIQSDWHQAGRKKGYKGDVQVDPELKKLADEYDKIWGERSDIYKEIRDGNITSIGDARSDLSLDSFIKEKTRDVAISGPRTVYRLEQFGEGSENIEVWYEPENKISKWSLYINNSLHEKFKTKSDVNEHLSKIGVLSDRLIQIKSQRTSLANEFNKLAAEKKETLRIGDFNRDIGKGAVPDAPFRKTWHEFALKRVLRMAAEQGYDRVAWTTGEQQAERYDLSKQIDSINWRKDSETTYEISAIRNGDSVVTEHGKTAEQLEDIIGKEVTAKIVAGEGRKLNRGGVRVLEGVDLKVGGEGMKGFYDNILVKAADKLVKKFGGKVGVSELGESAATRYIVNPATNLPGEQWWVTDTKDESDNGKLFDTKEEAEDAASDLNSEESSGEAGTKVHSLDITPELRDAALNQGFELFQGGDQGRIRFGANRQFNIDLLKNANPSTFLHELGHFYLEVMGDLAEAANASEQIKDDYKTLLDWFGVESRDQITVEHHEQFARGFEAYLMEGKAPSLKLRKAFHRFKIWLVSVYRQMKNLNVELTPEVKNVMNRLVATEDEIAHAEQEYNIQPMISDPTTFGMTGKDAERYMKARDDARMAAEELMLAKVMDGYTREKQKWWKEKKKELKAKLEPQINEMPVYKALSVLHKGTLPDGTKVDDIKLNRQALIDQYGAEFTKRLKHLYTREGGIHHDVVANLFGFESGDAMITEMVNMPSKTDFLEQKINEEMQSQYPDLLADDNELEAAALEAIHNEKRSELLKLELEHLLHNDLPVAKKVMRRAIKRMPPDKLIKETAQRILGSRQLSQIKPHLFLAAEKKASKEAAVAFTSGDLDAAYAAKEKELLNHELYKAAIEAKNDIKKKIDKFKKLWRKDEDLAKSRDINLVNAARAVLAEFGLGKTDKAAADYLEDMLRYDQEAYETMRSLVDSAIEGAAYYKAVSLDKFNEMAEAVLGLWDLAKQSQEITVDGKKMTKADAIEQLNSQLAAVGIPTKKIGYDKKASTWDEFKLNLAGFRSILTRVEQWAAAMDIGKRAAFTRIIVEPVQEGANEFRVARKEIIQKYLDIVKAVEKSITREPIKADEVGYTFEGKQELLGMLLHVGNQSNFRKLLLGRGWGSVNDDGTVNAQKFTSMLDRFHQEGVLTKADWDFVQSVWDLFESLKPPAQRAHKEMYGHYFSEVTADAFETPFGMYRGGYAPAIADSLLAADQDIREQKEQLTKSNNSFMFPTSGRGFTKSRVEQYTAPLTMDLGLIPRHIDKVLRFIHIEPRVKEVARLVFDRGFRANLDNFDKTIAGEMLVPWLQRAAQQQVEIPAQGRGWRGINNVFKTIRRNTGINIMAANVINTLQQVTGLSIAAVEVKQRFLRNALWSYVRSPEKYSASVAAKSKFMDTRVTTNVIEIQSHIDDLLLNPSKYEDLRAFAQKHGYFMQSGMQNVVDTIVWGGAYDQAIEGGASEKDAVRAGDAAVRKTQGSFNAEDLSAFEVGSPMFRAFTMFYSYFNMQANLLQAEFLKVVRSTGLKKGAGRLFYVYLFGFMIPAVVSELMVKAGSGDWDDDDDDQYMDDFLSIFFGSQFRTMTAMVPYVGQAVNALVNPWNDRPYDDRISTSPAISVIEQAARSPKSVYDAIADGGNKKKAVRDVLSLIGLLTGMPVMPLGKPAGYLIDVNEGKANPTGPIDFTRGLVTGRPGNR